MLPGIILFLAYVVLALGHLPGLRLDRTGAAVIGAILMVTVGGLSFDTAVAAVNHRTLVLLFGMMVLVAHLQLAGFFSLVARVVAGRLAHPVAMVTAIACAAAVLSALFVNDPVCLVLTPVVIDIAQLRRLNPLPPLLALATGSNVGSVATITGNPQNMLVGSLSGISFVHFTAVLGPVAVVGLAIDVVVIALVYRGRFHLTGLVEEPIVIDQSRLRRAQAALLAKPLLVAALMLWGFLAGFDPALVAAAGGAALLVTRRVKPEKIWRRIDWDLLVLFVGLFVIVRGAEQAGLDQKFFDLLRPIGLESKWGLSAMSAVLANLISNVPSVMLFSKFVPTLPDPRLGWLTLAMSSTLAGNLTILGSIANLIVVEGARKRDVGITFGEYLRVGVPVTIATLAFGTWWVY
jgi:Na+/H+ antiporter NhaD/arsenite permease-like protein